jgi:hypothetical protein
MHHHRDPCDVLPWPQPPDPPVHGGDDVTWHNGKGHQVTVLKHTADEFPFEQPGEPHPVPGNGGTLHCKVKLLPPGPYLYEVEACEHHGVRTPKTIIIS